MRQSSGLAPIRWHGSASLRHYGSPPWKRTPAAAQPCSSAPRSPTSRAKAPPAYIGPATLAAINRYLAAAGHSTGPLFRQVRRGGHASASPLGAPTASAPSSGTAPPTWTASPGGSAGTRSGSAARASSPPTARQRRRVAAGGRLEVADHSGRLHQARSGGTRAGGKAAVQGGGVAPSRVANGGAGLRGFRDAAIIRVGSRRPSPDADTVGAWNAADR